MDPVDAQVLPAGQLVPLRDVRSSVQRAYVPGNGSGGRRTSGARRTARPARDLGRLVLARSDLPFLVQETTSVSEPCMTDRSAFDLRLPPSEERPDDEWQHGGDAGQHNSEN